MAEAPSIDELLKIACKNNASDLIIRTGGEYRLSNFLLWQASYAEIYVTETMWPDFSREVFYEAIRNFQQRQRRFGRTGEQTPARLATT